MRAVIWTDVFQSVIMFGGLLTILIKVCRSIWKFCSPVVAKCKEYWETALVERSIFDIPIGSSECQSNYLYFPPKL